MELMNTASCYFIDAVPAITPPALVYDPQNPFGSRRPGLPEKRSLHDGKEETTHVSS
jgi:hypothetical protein